MVSIILPDRQAVTVVIVSLLDNFCKNLEPKIKKSRMAEKVLSRFVGGLNGCKDQNKVWIGYICCMCPSKATKVTPINRSEVAVTKDIVIEDFEGNHSAPEIYYSPRPSTISPKNQNSGNGVVTKAQKNLESPLSVKSNRSVRINGSISESDSTFEGSSNSDIGNTSNHERLSPSSRNVSLNNIQTINNPASASKDINENNPNPTPQSKPLDAQDTKVEELSTPHHQEVSLTENIGTKTSVTPDAPNMKTDQSAISEEHNLEASKTEASPEVVHSSSPQLPSPTTDKLSALDSQNLATRRNTTFIEFRSPESSNSSIIDVASPTTSHSDTRSFTTSQNAITDILSPVASHIPIVDQNGNSETFRTQNLSKSDSDLRYHLEQSSRASSNSAPSTAKILSFTPLDKPQSSDVPDQSIATSLPDSLNVVPQKQIDTTPQKRSTKIPSTLKPRSTRNYQVRKGLQKQASVVSPKQALNVTLAQLESKDWETSVKGLQAIAALLKENDFQINGHLHSVCVLIGKHIRSLRSQVARSACNASGELFTVSVKGLEMEIDDLAAALFHRTADTNKFLRNDAKNALNKMCENLPPSRVIAVILNKGSTHQNAIVRCESARLLYLVSQNVGYEKVFQFPKDVRDRILKTSSNFLTEGSCETRQHAQKLLIYLSQHKQFPRAIANTVSPSSMRLIRNVIQKQRLQT